MDTDRIVAQNSEMSPILPENSSDFFLHYIPRYVLFQDFLPASNVIQIGCGTIYGSQLLKSYGAERIVNIMPLGSSPRPSQIPGVAFLSSDYSRLPFIDNLFNVAFVFETITNLENPDKIFQEIKRVVASDGFIVFATHNFKRDYIKEIMGNAATSENYLPPSDYYSALSQNFEHITVLSQSPFMGYHLIEQKEQNQTRSKPIHISHELGVSDVESPLFYVFVASDLPIILEEDRLVQVPYSIITDRIFEGLRLYGQSIIRHFDIVEKSRVNIEALSEDIKKQNDTYQNLKQHIQRLLGRLDSVFTNLDILLIHSPHVSQELREELIRSKERIADLSEALNSNENQLFQLEAPIQKFILEFDTIISSIQFNLKNDHAPYPLPGPVPISTSLHEEISELKTRINQRESQLRTVLEWRTELFQQAQGFERLLKEELEGPKSSWSIKKAARFSWEAFLSFLQHENLDNINIEDLLLAEPEKPARYQAQSTFNNEGSFSSGTFSNSHEETKLSNKTSPLEAIENLHSKLQEKLDTIAKQEALLATREFSLIEKDQQFIDREITLEEKEKEINEKLRIIEERTALLKKQKHQSDIATITLRQREAQVLEQESGLNLREQLWHLDHIALSERELQLSSRENFFKKEIIKLDEKEKLLSEKESQIKSKEEELSDRQITSEKQQIDLEKESQSLRVIAKTLEDSREELLELEKQNAKKERILIKAEQDYKLQLEEKSSALVTKEIELGAIEQILYEKTEQFKTANLQLELAKQQQQQTQQLYQQLQKQLASTDTELHQIIAETEQLLEDKTANLADSENTIVELREQISIIKPLLEQKEELIKNIETSLKEKSDLLQVAQIRLPHLETQVQKLLQENTVFHQNLLHTEQAHAETSAKLALADQTVSFLQEQVSNYLNENTKKSQSIIQLEHTFAENAQKLQTTEQSLLSVKEQLENLLLERNSTRQQIEKIEKDATVLEFKKDEQEKYIEEMQHKISSLQLELSELLSYKQSIDSSLKELLNNLEEKNKLITSLEQIISEKDQLLANESIKLTKEEQNLAESSNMIQILKQQIESIDTLLKEKIASEDRLKEELNNKFNIYNEKILSLENIIETKMGIIKTIEEEKESLKKSILDLELSALNKISSSSEEFQEKLLELTSNLQDKEKTISLLNNEIDDLKNDLSELNAEQKLALEAIQKLKDKNTQLLLDKDELEDNIKTQKHEISSLQSLIENLKEEKSQQDSTILEQVSNLEQLEYIKKNLESKVDELSEIIRAKSFEIEKNVSEIERLAEDNKDLSNSLKNSNTEFFEKQEAAVLERQKLKDDISKAIQAIQRLEDELEISKHKNMEKEAQIEQLELELLDLKKTYASQNKLLNESELVRRENENLISALQTSLSETQDKIFRLEESSKQEKEQNNFIQQNLRQEMKQKLEETEKKLLNQADLLERQLVETQNTAKQTTSNLQEIEKLLQEKEAEVVELKDQLQKSWKKNIEVSADPFTVDTDPGFFAPVEGDSPSTENVPLISEKISRLEKDIATKELVLSRLQKELDLKSTHNRSLQDTISRQREDLDKIKGKIREAIEYIGKLHQENQQKEQELETLRKQLQQNPSA